jgi:hypothetical protein
MKQVARNLTDLWDGFLLGKRYLLHDRDPLFTEEVRGLLRDAGVKPLRLPAKICSTPASESATVSRSVMDPAMILTFSASSGGELMARTRMPV